MFERFIRGIEIAVCTLKGHELVKKRVPVENSDLYNLHTVCIKCPYKSDGITTGGHRYTELIA